MALEPLLSLIDVQLGAEDLGLFILHAFDVERFGVLIQAVNSDASQEYAFSISERQVHLFDMIFCIKIVSNIQDIIR
jgi:hypothetical protein